MPEIRFIGGIAALIAIGIGVAGLRRHRAAGILRMRDIAVLILGAWLIALALFPEWFDAAAGLVGVDSLEGRRVAIATVLGFALVGITIFILVGRIADLQTQVGDLALALAARTPVFERNPTYPERFIAVVIPAYNEAEALPDVLKSVPAESGGLPILTFVVSDGSTDATVEVGSQGAYAVLERPLRRGSGAAVRTGTAFALARGAEVVVTLDADGQHDPHEIESLVEPILAGEADLVQGSRTVNSEEVSGHRMRAIGVTTFGWILRTLAGVDTNDPSNGFRAITAQGYLQLDLTEDQFYVGELVVRSSRSDLRVVEVPVNVNARTHGESKKPHSAAYGYGFARGIVRAMFRSPSGR
jgi:hypothetical protein